MFPLVLRLPSSLELQWQTITRGNFSGLNIIGNICDNVKGELNKESKGRIIFKSEIVQTLSLMDHRWNLHSICSFAVETVFFLTAVWVLQMTLCWFMMSVGVPSKKQDNFSKLNRVHRVHSDSLRSLDVRRLHRLRPVMLLCLLPWRPEHNDEFRGLGDV